LLCLHKRFQTNLLLSNAIFEFETCVLSQENVFEKRMCKWLKSHVMGLVFLSFFYNIR